jgi:hypothetical protein
LSMPRLPLTLRGRTGRAARQGPFRRNWRGANSRIETRLFEASLPARRPPRSIVANQASTEHVDATVGYPSALPKREGDRARPTLGGGHPYASLWVRRSKSGSLVTTNRTHEQVIAGEVTMAFFRPLAIVCQYTDVSNDCKTSFWATRLFWGRGSGQLVASSQDQRLAASRYFVVNLDDGLNFRMDGAAS